MLLSQPRIKEILLTLNQQNFVSPTTLSSKLKVTSRTIRNDIKSINIDLKSYNTQIYNARNKGYYLKTTDSTKFNKLITQLKNESKTELFTPHNKESMTKFLLLILVNNINIDDIMSKLFISESSFKKYFNEARSILQKYNLKISEKNNIVNICGNESDIRSCFVDYIDDKKTTEYVRGFSKIEKKLFYPINLNDLSDKLAELTSKLNITISDFSNKNLVIHLALTIKRSMEHKDLKSFNRKIPIINTPVYVEIKKYYIELFEKYGLKVNDSEFQYFLYHYSINYPEILNNNQMQSNVDNERISNTVLTFLDKIKDVYVFNLVDDGELIYSLEKHLKLLLKVKKIQVKRVNPLLDVIVSTFPLAYEMTVLGAPIIEKSLNIKLSKDELSFIALHIGASMERLYDNRWQKKRVALVCGSGTATAQILKFRLESQFKEYITITGVYSLYEFKNKKFDDDFIISTVPIFDSKLPVVQVDLSNFTSDSFQLYQYLVSISDQKQLVMKLFDDRFIYIIDEPVTKNEILDLMINDFKRNNIVTNEFKKNVYLREKMYPTTIGGGIATPHPLKYSGIESKVGFAKLEKAADWDGKKVKYVFLISISKDEYSSIQDLFTLLVDLQDNEEFRNLIDKCRTKQEVKVAFRTILERIRFDK